MSKVTYNFFFCEFPHGQALPRTSIVFPVGDHGEKRNPPSDVFRIETFSRDECTDLLAQ